jgi:LPS-assembly lipoprotein
MLLFNRRKFLTVAATPLALSACGFTPIYSDGSAADRMHGRITLGSFDGLDGFQMREQLESRLGAASTATHRLDVVLNIDSDGVAITADGSITRYNLSGTAKFTVTQQGGGIVFQDSVTAFTAYNATASAYATRIAEQDATRRMAVTVADKIVTRLATSAEDWLK